MIHHLPFWRSAPGNKQMGNIPITAKPITLAEVRNGHQATITGYGSLSPAYRQHLQAYGLMPGRTIMVLAQQPVTIVLVEHTELAFEGEIAREVLVA